MKDRKAEPVEVTCKHFNLRRHKKARRIEIRLRILLDTKVCKELPTIVRDAYRLVRDTTNNLEIVELDKDCAHLYLEFRETPEQKRSSLRLPDVSAEKLVVSKDGDDIAVFLSIITEIDDKVLSWGGKHFSYNCFASFDLAQMELISAEEQEANDKLERSLGLKENEPPEPDPNKEPEQDD